MRIHFAILTHNALAYSQRCIESVRAHTSLPFDVQILDNASSDGTQAWLAAINDSRIHVHGSSVNLGVPGGRNELLRLVLPRAQDEDFVIFLDNDIELHEGWHQPFERVFEAHPRAGMASKVGYAMQVRGDTRDPQALPWETGRVDIVAGGFACWARVEAIREVGTLDENLGLFWHEDDDWAVRFTAHGWSIWSVPEAPMTHHEHASGVAWPSLENGDSCRNLAYLTAKWRELGYLDDEGWIRDRDRLFYPSLEVRAEIRTRLGRVEPLSRGEYAEAFWDLHALLATVRQGRVFPRPISPCLTVLLELLCENRLFDASPEILALYESLSQSLEDMRALRTQILVEPVDNDGKRRPAHGLARSGSWEDPDWFQAFRALKGLGSSADWYGRSSLDWAETSLLLALAEPGALAEGSRGLILDPRDVSLSLALVEEGCDLLLSGHFDMVSEARGELPAEFLDQPGRWLGGKAGAIRVCQRRDLDVDSRFDFVVARLGLVTDSEDPTLRQILAEMAERLAPGGQLGLIVECLVGQDGQTAFSPETSIHGLVVRPDFQTRTDAGALTSIGAPIPEGRAPDLCRSQGKVFQTHALLLYEKPAVLAPAVPVTIPERDCEVLVDLRGMDWTKGMVDATREGCAQIEIALRSPLRPRVTFLGDGMCPPPLLHLLNHPGVQYRDSLRDSCRSPDLVQYLEGLRSVPPCRMTEWGERAVLGWLSSPPRDGLRRGQDSRLEMAYLHFLQREAMGIVVPGSDSSSWPDGGMGLARERLRFVQASRATLQPSPVSVPEALAIVGMGDRYVLLEGSIGAREQLTTILDLLEEEVAGGDLEVLAFGREFLGFETLKGAGRHPVLDRMRFVAHLPEPLRRPLFEGASFLIDARHPGESRLAATEAFEVDLRVSACCMGDSQTLRSTGMAPVPCWRSGVRRIEVMNRSG